MFSSQLRNAIRRCAGCALSVASVLALTASPALARDAYVANSGSGTVSVFDIGTNAAVGTIAVGAGPRGVAITPDGRFAYVTNETDGTVSVIDTAARVVVATVPLAAGSKPRGVAISPDGQTAWVANFGDGTVSVIGTAANSVSGAPIVVGAEPDGIAVSPDGVSVFVAQRSGNVSIISASSRALTGTVVDALGPAQLVIGPRGGRGFVTNSAASSVTAFNPANGQVVGLPIPVGAQPSGIAIGPNGAFAYAAGFGDGTLTPISTSTNAAGAAIAGFNGPEGVAVNPAGSQGYVVNSGGGSVTAFNTTTNAPLASVPVGSAPSGIAIVPDQGPRASFWVSPTRRRVKKRLTFHAAGSSDPDGQVATYAWDFGDGGRVKGTAATRVHTYRKPGTYQVTLVTTDDEGCSTEVVYTGQTASCNGSAAAAASAAITVVDATGPVLDLAGGKRQRLRGRVNVFARCPREPCAVIARGVVVTAIERRGSLRRSRYRLGTASASLLAGAWGRLALRIPPRKRRALSRILRRGGEARANLTVVASDETGNQTLRKRTVRLILPRRRTAHP